MFDELYHITLRSSAIPRLIPSIRGKKSFICWLVHELYTVLSNFDTFDISEMLALDIFRMHLWGQRSRGPAVN